MLLASLRDQAELLWKKRQQEFVPNKKGYVGMSVVVWITVSALLPIKECLNQ